MTAPPVLRLVAGTQRYAMLARGLRLRRTPLPEGSLVAQMGHLDGRGVYEKAKKRRLGTHRGPAPAASNGGTTPDPPLTVFLHGLGSSVVTWSSVLPEIARSVPVVAPDLPGFGRTPLPKGSPFANLREHVEASQAFIDAVSPDAPVQLVGQSLGGWIAGRVACQRPDRIARLTLINSTGILHPQILEQRRLFSPRDQTEITELWERMWYRLPTTFRLLKKQFLQLTRTPIVRGFMDTVEERDFLDPEALSRIRAPTLLVWGLADRLVDYEFCRAFRSGIRDVRFRPIPDCGHVPQREAPDTFLRYVLPWLQGEEPPEPDRPGLRATPDGTRGGTGEQEGASTAPPGRPRPPSHRGRPQKAPTGSA